MAITIREQQDNASVTTTTHTFTLSAGTQVGDTIVAISANNANTVGNLTDPPGGTAVTTWTLQHTLDSGSAANHAKVWTGTVTTGGAQTVTVSETSQDSFYGGVFVLAGSVPFDTAASSPTSVTSVTTEVAPSVTPTVGATNDLLICLFGVLTGGPINYTMPGSMTAYTERDVTGQNTYRAASEQLTSHAATGTRTATTSFGRKWFAVSILMGGVTTAAQTPLYPVSQYRSFR